MKSIFTQFLFLLLCLFIETNMFAQGIVSTESFDANPFAPTGWSIKPPATTNVWVRQTTLTNPTTTPHSGAAVARFRSRNVTAGTKQTLISRAVDYSNRGTNTANLSLWMYRESSLPGNLDSMTIWVSSVDSLDSTALKLGTIARNRSVAIPDTQAVNGWYQYTYAIPVSFTGTSNYFIFEGTGESAVVNSGANMYIDDISFDEFPPICTGTPNVGNIVNANPFHCGGTGSSNLSLSAPINGLIGLSYLWESASNAAGPWTNAGTNQTLVTGALTTTTYYRCTVNCSFSSLNYTTPVDSVFISNAIPPTITLNTNAITYCDGASGVELIASGAPNFSWFPAAGLNTTLGDTVIANPVVSTQYIVTGIDSNGCSASDTVSVNYNAGPNVNITTNPNDSVCEGTTVIMTALNPGVTGNVYLWSNGITTRRDTIVATTTTSFSVIVTNSAGCSKTDSITITVFPDSSANFGFTNTGSLYNFIDSSFGATGWIWTFGDGNGSSNQNPTYIYPTAGTYTVTLIALGGPCGADTITKVITVGAVSVASLSSEKSIVLYPNPVMDELQVKLDYQEIKSISIRNSIGQVVLQENALQNKSISVKGLHAGIYFVEVQTSAGKYRSTFSKQ